MKRIYIYLLSAIASLAFVPAVSAQTIADVIGEDTYNSFPQVSYTINKNVALSKQVSSPTADGTYWIKLEAFATGSASIITNSTPSDVLLVLDLSNSMVDNKYPVNSSTTRLEALQTACKAFIGSLYDNAVAASAAADDFAAYTDTRCKRGAVFSCPEHDDGIMLLSLLHDCAVRAAVYSAVGAVSGAAGAAGTGSAKAHEIFE